MYGFTINDRHSYNDFGLRIMNREINPPKKNKIKERVPFMNGSYDFSDLYGDQNYEERIIVYTLDFKYKDKIEYFNKKIEISDWLVNSEKEKLFDDLIPGYYFLAECEGELKFKEYSVGCEINVKFIAYPFKIANNIEGSDIWDEFNFELDYAQDTKYNVDGSKIIDIYNPSVIKITPTIHCSAPISLIKNGITYKFNVGTTKDWRFDLDKGKNKLTIIGNGNIEFIFRKEVL